ncbi:MAG: hypothetical protein KF805_12630 [Phycisphaeraceae bacterium]|nr:hypothetical protein [Phycisphaeraceae bacterium]
MNDDLPTLFRAAHAAIGDEIVPDGFERDEFVRYLNVTPNVAHSGIVHTLQWLVKQHMDNSVSLSSLGVEVSGIEFYETSHRNTPASIYAALLRLATRVAQEKRT